MPSKKPTAKMLEVLKLMKEGWELASSNSMMDSRTRLQKGGTGKGGEVKGIHSSTFWGLLQRGLIKRVKEDWPDTIYGLVEEHADA